MFPLPGFLNFAEHRAAWFAGALGTVVMIVFFGLTLDGPSISRAWQALPARVFVVVIICLGINGVLDGLWLNIITRGSARTGQAYRVVAWHLLLSSLLPARLGDLGWIYFIHGWLKQPASRAIFVTAYHRLQDVIVVSAMLVLSLVAARADMVSPAVIGAAVVVFGVMVCAGASLGHLLGLAGRVLLRLQRRWPTPALAVLCRSVLRIRVWYRHRLKRDQVMLSFGVIVLRWISILCAIMPVILVLAPAISAADSFFLANAYIYFGVVPLQAVGGFGAGEAGLAWLLTFYGFGLAQASALGLLLRLLINLVHVCLWLAILAALWLAGRRYGAAELVSK